METPTRKKNKEIRKQEVYQNLNDLLHCVCLARRVVRRQLLQLLLQLLQLLSHPACLSIHTTTTTHIYMEGERFWRQK
jgi:hypothetical protein